MRDLIVILIIAIGALWSIRRPWIGVMMWTWVSIMNPHRLSWKISNWPVAALIAGCTLLGLLFTRERRQPLYTPEALLLLMFMIWMTITYPFSIFREISYDMWDRVMKIDFMILVAFMLLYTKRHIMALCWVLVVSMGYYGVKGGIFTILTGGSFRVWGPSGTFIEGNNEIALALIISIPLMRFLQMQLRPENKWGRHALTGAMLLSAVAAIGSHSRGALLAIIAMAFVLWLRSRQKIMTGGLIVMMGLLVVIFMPKEWMDRMNTIQSYQEDGSAMGRINAWHMAWNLASDRFFGGGYSIYTQSIFRMYAPNPTDVHAAHSVYFQVLGEHGFVGLFLFLLIWIVTWFSAAWIRKKGAAQPETAWTVDLAGMCQVALTGYAVGGAFLSLAYFDLPYYIMVLTALTKVWLKRRAWEQEVALPNPSPPARNTATV